MRRGRPRRRLVIALAAWVVTLTGSSVWLVSATGWRLGDGAPGVRVDQVVAHRSGTGFTVQAQFQAEKAGECLPAVEVGRVDATSFTVDGVAPPRDGFSNLPCTLGSDRVDLFQTSTDPTGTTVRLNGTAYSVAGP